MNYTSYFKTPEPFVKKVKKFIHDPEHIILYGPENSGKYTQALHIINQFSKSNLKYSRKIELEINSEKYYFNISDIHFEIDFELLGTNETTIWFEFILAITSIIDIQGKSILLCKNAHCMKDELLYIFHTFMRDPNLKLILCTKNVSYFPSQIKDKCLIFNLKQIKHINSYSQQYKLYCDQIIEFINIQSNDLFLLRELLYSLMTYNCDIHTCLYYIYGELIKNKYLDVAHLKSSFKNSIDILKHYNTNYRPIYHLELFILELHALRHTSIK